VLRLWSNILILLNENYQRKKPFVDFFLPQVFAMLAETKVVVTELNKLKIHQYKQARLSF